MEQATTMFPKTTIGLDLGDKISHGCVLDAAARVTDRFRVTTDRAGIERTFGTRAPCRVVIEVGTHSPWVARALEGMGHEVIVANPREVVSISRSTRKNDRADAEQLARLGRADPQLLRPIRHRGERVQRDRAVLAVRRKLVDTRASLVAQAHGLAKGLGARLPRGRPEAFVKNVRPVLDEEIVPGLVSLVEVVARLDEQIRVLDDEIERLSRTSYPETELLRQVPGVGPISALTYVLTLEDPSHFATSRRVGSYLGMRPKQRDSGNRRSELSISKEGDRELRRLLVQCAQWIIARGPDSDLKRAGMRRIERGGAAAKKKAVVAVARKLSVLLHHLWKTGEVYEPLHHQIHQAA